MNAREKTLAGIVGGLVVLLVAGLGLRALLFAPVKKIDQEIAGVRDKLAAIAKERKAFFVAEDKVKQQAARTFDDTVDTASAKSGEMLTRKIVACGLQETDFTRLPVGPRKLRGASEIGWSVQGEGRLSQVINLLFLLQETPHLHRLDGLNLLPGERPGEVKVRFRFLTLVIDPAPTVERAELPRPSIDSPDRRLLDGLVERDLLRPYIKRPPAPPKPATSVTPSTTPGPESLRIVDLSQWQGQSEVAVLDATQQRTIRYRPGDPLAGGVILGVESQPPGPRTLADPPRKGRLLLKIGNDYWAVDLGRTLAEKYKLAADQLPADLPKL
jgi:hypothetical protein